MRQHGKTKFEIFSSADNINLHKNSHILFNIEQSLYIKKSINISNTTLFLVFEKKISSFMNSYQDPEKNKINKKKTKVFAQIKFSFSSLKT